MGNDISYIRQQMMLNGRDMYSHSLYDLSHFVLVGSLVEIVPCVEHVVDIVCFLLR